MLKILPLLLGLALPASLLAAEPEAPNSIFLVAKRQLQDPNFRQAVVLVTQHGRGGPVGVIVNRPTQVPLSQVFPKNDSLDREADKLFFGGPVSRMTLVFVFRSETRPKEALEVLKGVYLSFSAELLSDLLKRPKPTMDLRVYAGYSGWAPGQLESEISRGDWYVINADAETIFRKESSTVWPELVKRASMRTTCRQIHQLFVTAHLVLTCLNRCIYSYSCPA